MAQRNGLETPQGGGNMEGKRTPFTLQQLERGQLENEAPGDAPENPSLKKVQEVKPTLLGIRWRKKKKI